MTARRQAKVWLVTIDGRPDSAWSNVEAARKYCDGWRIAWERAALQIGSLPGPPFYQVFEMEIRNAVSSDEKTSPDGR